MVAWIAWRTEVREAVPARSGAYAAVLMAGHGFTVAVCVSVVVCWQSLDFGLHLSIADVFIVVSRLVLFLEFGAGLGRTASAFWGFGVDLL